MQPTAADAPLVATKLFVPRLRPNLVHRERLHARLDESRHVVLVSAPAGSGKSTLLAEWVATCEDRVAWLSLESPDDQPRRFVNYILATLRNAEATTWSETFDAEMLQPVLIELLNSVAEGSRSVTLILDDYHVIESDAIHGIVQFLVDHLPPNLRLVISTRADPPLALSRLRARGMLVEIRAGDLRFSMHEAAQFFNESMGLHLENADVAELERRTEGWAVGLQMAAISLRGRSAPNDFIAGFTGSNRYVLDYLTDEVLARQSSDVRQFLIETSILERLSAPLCNAITGRSDADRILQLLDASNIFLISLDDRRTWYRYHHLFSTLLQHQLERSLDGDAIRVLHQRASDWFNANNSPDAAIDHAMAANDLDRARAVVEQHAFARLHKADSTSVRRWLSMLRPEDLQNRVDLLVYQAIVGVLEFQIHEVDAAITRAEQLVTDETPKELQACILTMRGLTLRSYGRTEEANEKYTRALELVAPGTRWHAIVSYEFAQSALAEADIRRAEDILVASKRPGVPERAISAVVSRSILAMCRLIRAHPEDSIAVASELIGWIEQWDREDHGGLALAGLPYAALANVHRHWNDLSTARECAERAIEYGRRGFFIGAFEGKRSLLQVATAEGDYDTALRLADELVRSIQSTVHVPGTKSLKWLKHSVQFRKGDLASVAAAIDEAHLLERPYRVNERKLASNFAMDAFLLASRFLISQKRMNEALDLTDEILEFAWSHDTGLTVIEVLILRSLAQQGDKAVTTMLEALELASRPRFIRLFVDEGAAVLPILERAAPRVRDRDFAAAVVGAFKGPAPSQVVTDNTLSQREIEVLQIVAAGASNSEAGKKLFISPSTVKKHLENIYGKLAVAGRVQAIARAKELRLI